MPPDVNKLSRRVFLRAAAQDTVSRSKEGIPVGNRHMGRLVWTSPNDSGFQQYLSAYDDLLAVGIEAASGITATLPMLRCDTSDFGAQLQRLVRNQAQRRIANDAEVRVAARGSLLTFATRKGERIRVTAA